jgi:hypothetical protein
VYENTLQVVFKDDEAKNELTVYFKNPTDVNATTIQLIAYFPTPLEFDYCFRIKAEEMIAKRAFNDGLLNG